jgi:hypothetical protein
MPRDRRGEDSKGLTPHPVRSRLYLSDTDRHARRKGTLCAALRTLGAEPWNTKFLLKGGPLEGQHFELPPGTIEIVTVGKNLMPRNDRYQVVVRDSGVSAMWVGSVAANEHSDDPCESSRCDPGTSLPTQKHSIRTRNERLRH